VFKSILRSYDTNPPNVDTDESAPEFCSNMIRSACTAIFITSFFDSLQNNPLTEAVASTHAADDDPSPTPVGISESNTNSIPLFEEFSFIALYAT